MFTPQFNKFIFHLTGGSYESPTKTISHSIHEGKLKYSNLA